MKNSLHRQYICNKLKLLRCEEAHTITYISWGNRRLAIRLPEVTDIYSYGQEVIVKSGGKFYLKLVVEKDGLKLHDTSRHIQHHQIMAVVVNSYFRLNT